MLQRYILGAACYLLASFPIAYYWHLVIFKHVYDRLEIYRDDVIVPLGLATMILQAGLFSWLYPRLFPTGGYLINSLKYALFGSLLSISYTTLPVAAKFPMASTGDFLLIESIYSAVQWCVAAPLIALCFQFPQPEHSIASDVKSRS